MQLSFGAMCALPDLAPSNGHFRQTWRNRRFGSDRTQLAAV
jgi:hypothetical protein